MNESEAACQMSRLATSPTAPLSGKRLPVRGPGRLLNRPYLRTHRCARGPELVLRTKAGDLFQVHQDGFQERQLWTYVRLDDHVSRLFSYLVQPGDRCVDVGAGIGLHTVRLARLTGATGQVIGIEPDSQMARRAEANVALNGLVNVQIIQAAASALTGEAVSLYRPANLNPNRGMASLHPHAHLTGTAMQVTTTTIDEACPGPVELIRIDVGGHEAAVVAGAAATIERHSPAIVFEHAASVAADPAQGLFGWLADAGYLLYRIVGRRNRLIGHSRLRLEPVYVQPDTVGDLLAISEPAAPRIIPLVATRDGQV
jgi:FkbM family methyltransferase